MLSSQVTKLFGHKWPTGLGHSRRVSSVACVDTSVDVRGFVWVSLTCFTSTCYWCLFVFKRKCKASMYHFVQQYRSKPGRVLLHKIPQSMDIPTSLRNVMLRLPVHCTAGIYWFIMILWSKRAVAYTIASKVQCSVSMVKKYTQCPLDCFEDILSHQKCDFSQRRMPVYSLHGAIHRPIKQGTR